MSAETVPFKLLIDEDLSPKLVERLAGRGIFAQHIAHLGREGMTDPELWRYAYDHDLVVVTVNVSDFLMLASPSELHAGVIAIRGASLTRDESWAWLDLVNKLVEVHGPGDFVVRDIPSR